MYNVICVKFGTKYSSDFVNKLYNDLKKVTQSEFKFYCYTDDASGIDSEVNIIFPLGKPTLKKVWNKLRLFDPAMPFKGKTYFFDLDVKILKDPLIYEDERDWEKLTLIHSHWKIGKLYNRLSNYDVKINSSVMMWDASNPEMHEYWNHFNSGFRDYFMRKYVGIDRYIVHEDFTYFIFNHEYIQSKKHQSQVKYDPCVLTFEEIDVGINDLI
jgi:hypothetical protein